jgi:hypothetical protein
MTAISSLNLDALSLEKCLKLSPSHRYFVKVLSNERAFLVRRLSDSNVTPSLFLQDIRKDDSLLCQDGLGGSLWDSVFREAALELDLSLALFLARLLNKDSRVLPPTWVPAFQYVGELYIILTIVSPTNGSLCLTSRGLESLFNNPEVTLIPACIDKILTKALSEFGH